MKKYIAVLLALVVLATGCSKQEKVGGNPNNPRCNCTKCECPKCECKDLPEAKYKYDDHVPVWIPMDIGGTTVLMPF